MAAVPYMTFYIADYLSHAWHLTVEEWRAVK